MKKTFSSKKSGFSLIELSIVLIVIGLLIAGVTGGASLIKSSELRSVMSEARGYSVAVSGFFSQFNSLPGDYDDATLGTMTSAATPTSIGDGDGRIEYCAGTCATTTVVGSESTIAWFQLDVTGTIDTALTYISAASVATPGTHFPSSKIKSAGWVFDNETTNNRNVVVLTGNVGAVTATATSLVNGTSVATGAITAADALSIDSKIDDGRSATGLLRGINAVVTPTANCTDGSTAGYVVSTTSKACAISYSIDVNS